MERRLLCVTPLENFYNSERRAMLRMGKREGGSVRLSGKHGIYCTGMGDVFLGTKRCVLKDAVPPFPAQTGSDAQSGSIAYGWVSKGLPTPATGGLYAVEFSGKDDVRVLAYIDIFGRVFCTDDVLTVPPAREPDLSFTRYPDQLDRSEGEGCVCVHDASGAKTEVAQYRFARGCFSLFDSWYDFGPHGVDLSYADAVVRAFFALVYRPSLGAPVVPERRMRNVFVRLNEGNPLAAFRAIVKETRGVEDDSALKAPALVRCLARWLSEAGLDDLDARGVKDDALRLVRTTQYANTYYLAVEDDQTDVSVREVWALEAALNRFLLVYEALGESATLATDIDCARWDDFIIETTAVQNPVFDDIVGVPEGIKGGEWELRCAVGSMLERLRLPFRIGVLFRSDVASGVAAFDVTVPDGTFMPRWVLVDDGRPSPVDVSSDHRVDNSLGSLATADDSTRDSQAHRYAMHMGLVLAAAVFESSPAVNSVNIVARPLAEPARSDEEAQDGEFPGETHCSAFYHVTFHRSAFDSSGQFEAARAGDPFPQFVACGAHFDVESVDAFSMVDSLSSAIPRCELPEACDELLPDFAHITFGCDTSRDMRVYFNAALRHMAEGLADDIARSSSTLDATRLVRAAQEKACAAGDVRADAACRRLMVALAEGGLDTSDQNAVVGCFLGEDRCLMALGHANAVEQSDPEKAADILINAVTEASVLDGFLDDSKIVYRSFDSYAGRLLYNRARNDRVDVPQRAAADAGKRVELAPDSFYQCHIEIVRLLEHSFERTDEALRFGLRSLDIAPATAVGYRQLGRAYMLVGDMENAASTLEEGLRVTIQPGDIALEYYQLAYVLWKLGHARAGAACYLKSLVTSPVAALQATAELQELVEETGVALIDQDSIDEELTACDVPVAPSNMILKALDESMAVAVDAGLFPVARNVLSLRLRYRPDDALANVLRSLEEPANALR